MDEIHKNRKVTVKHIISVINKSRPTVERVIIRLIEVEIIERVGSTKSGYWEIKV